MYLEKLWARVAKNWEAPRLAQGFWAGAFTANGGIEALGGCSETNGLMKKDARKKKAELPAGSTLM